MIFISSKISDGNMDFRFGDAEEISKNRNKFFESLNINPKDVTEVTQIHGNKVLCLNIALDPKTEADGLITKNENLYLMLKIADCMAISFYDPKQNCVGLAHVGRKGLEKGIIKKMIKSMKENFDIDPKDIIIKISPSIGPCCYQMDIWKKAEKQLINCGILKENIDNPKICTYHNKKYFSHRRAEDKKQKDFRFVTILGLKEPC